MSVLKLLLQNDCTQFTPGQTISGAAGWVLNASPKRAEVRLFWFTRGKGTVDTTVLAVQPFQDPLAEESRTFQFHLPADATVPYSFSGKLISLVWAVELAVNKKETSRIEITVSPTGREIELYANGSSDLRARPG